MSSVINSLSSYGPSWHKVCQQFGNRFIPIPLLCELKALAEFDVDRLPPQLAPVFLKTRGWTLHVV
jgi:hypothetical protein